MVAVGTVMGDPRMGFAKAAANATARPQGLATEMVETAEVVVEAAGLRGTRPLRATGVRGAAAVVAGV